MTTYNLNLTLNEGPIGSSVSRILANLTSDEPALMAATLRAAADRLDPPRPTLRERLDATRRRATADQRFREGLAGYDVEGRTGTRDRACNQPGHGTTGCDCGTPVVGARCEGDACAEGHTYTPGCLLSGPPDRLAERVTAKPHGAWACRMGGQPHAGTCDEPRPLDGGKRSCPRIAHESGGVLTCTVDHPAGIYGGMVHLNSAHAVMWADDDDRIVAEQ